MPSSNPTLWRISWLLIGLTVIFIVVWQAPAFYMVKGLASYLPLHLFSETFSIVVSMMVFGVAWNVYTKERPSNIVVLACALLAVGLIDFAHMLSFKGMPDFITPSGPEKAINLWLFGRLLTALTLLAVALRPWQPLRHPRTRYGLLVGALALAAIVSWLGLAYPQAWPRTFIEGQGLTPLKVGAEYAIIALLLMPAVLFYLQAKRSQPYDAGSLFAATAITILSELCFTLYSDVTDIFNLLGHLYKIVAYAFIYRAVFVTSVRNPFQRLDAEFTENQRIAKQMRTASRYTRSLIEASLDPLVTISAQGKITDVNHATEQATGRDRSELIGADFCDYFTDPDKAREGYQEVFAKGFVTDYPLALRHRDGHVTDVLYNASVYRDENGEIQGVFAAARDITQFKRAEAARLQLAAIVESSNDAIVGKTTEGIITSWNKGAETIYGYVANEILGKSFTTLAPTERHNEMRELLEKIRCGGTVINHDAERLRKDGTRIHVALSLSPIRNEAGDITGISTIARDITERKRAEEAVRESQARFVTIFNQAPLGIALIDSFTGQIHEVNPRFAEIAGRTTEEMLAIDWMSITHPDDVQKDLDNMALLNAGKISGFRMDKRYIRPDGSVVWINMTIAPLNVEKNKSPRHLCMIDDITERKRIENEIRELNNDFVTLLENTGDFIYFKDKDSRFRFCSQTLARITGHPGWRDMIGKHDLEVFPQDTARIYYEEELPIFREGKPLLNKTDPYYDAQGRPGWVSTNKWPVFGDDKKTVVGIFGISRDITELKAAQRKILELNNDLERRVTERTAQLEAANKELEAFSYSVSHDLRIPLRAIDGFSSILLDDYTDKLDDEGRRLLNVVRDNTIRMSQLIDDILNFSRTGRLEFNFSEVDMTQLAQAVFDELRPAPLGSQLQLEIEPLPPAQGDRAMLRQVFVNLLSNALKFSRSKETAKIKIGGSVQGNEAVFFVQDNGVGFDMQYVDKLFGVFQRLHSVNEFEGTGIGLAIVKRIITRHGGRVWAEGGINAGATIYFALPIEEQIHE